VSEDSLNQLKQLLKEFYREKDVKIYLFGSRAKGNFRENSDVDIAIEGQDLNISTLTFILEESNIPYKVDVIDLSKAPEALKEEVLKTGIRWL